MEIRIKKFEELNLEELYFILQLRSEVFVVEQQCIYQDIDGKDPTALHVIGFVEGLPVAYTRCFNKGFYFREAAIGRVLVRETFRHKGFGHKLIKASITAIKEHFHTGRIRLSAQQYLISFYRSHGFKEFGNSYLEDGIPHIAMLLE